MAKKTSKKAKTTRKAAKKPAGKKLAKKSLAKKKSGKKKSAKTSKRKQAKKPAKKTSEKVGKKKVVKAAKPQTTAKGGVKQPRTKPAIREAAPAKAASAPQPAENAVPNIVSVEAKAETKKRAKKISAPSPVETADAARRDLPASPEPAVEAAPAQHLFANVLARVHAACAALATEAGWPAGTDLSRVVVEPPRDASHGDMATNAAMVLARDAKAKPRDLAEQIAAKLREDELVASVDVAGPGFINLTLKPQVWSDALRTVLREGASYGKSTLGAGEKVDVEYVSANPTGPIHVGHCRGAVFGDALCSLLQFAGFDVTREYYVNDAGAQVDVLARSAFLRYLEALGENIGAIPEGLYPGDYLKPVGEALAAEYGDGLRAMPEGRWLPIARNKAIAMMMDEIKGDLAALGIRHDVFFSERSLIETGNNRVTETIDYLRSKGDVYEGRLPPPKGGAPVEDYEDREQTLFRATAYGDDVDRPLMKSDGSYTYFASDIANHKNKFDRGFSNLIDVFGADHGGYVKRMQAAVKAVTSGKAALDVKIVQLVRLLRNGEPVKMSKRSGDFVTLREVVDEVGSDAVRFMMLFRKNDAVLDFDLAKVIEQSKDNAVFYVQYGHARGHSVFRNARAVIPDLPEEAGVRAAFLREAAVERLTDPAELDLLRRLAAYPRMVEAAAAAHEPHRIAFYLYDLASEFHGLWNRGHDLPYLRFIINNDAEITKARLALVQGVVSVLASGLAVLGVDAPAEMR